MSSRAEQLRRSFDQSFAEPAVVSQTVLERFLAIGTSGGDHAVRLGEITGLFTGRKIVSVPSAIGELAGVIGLRGALLPVYSLDLLLGATSSKEEPQRWLVVANEVGFSFARFDGYVQAAPSDVIAGMDAAGRAHETLRVAGKDRPIVTLASLVERIRTRVRALEQKE